MFRKLVLVFVGCVLSATALGGACNGKACRYAIFGGDREGCLEIRNSGREDIHVTVYTAGSGTITVRIMGGHTGKVYKIGRMCVPATDYIRADAEFEGEIFSPPTH